MGAGASVQHPVTRTRFIAPTESGIGNMESLWIWMGERRNE